MAVKKTARPAGKAKNALACGICGFRVIVDEACSCVEEHILLCCGKPMARASKRPTAKTSR